MKKIIAIALALTTMVALCACIGDTSDGSASDGGSKAEPTCGGEITVGIQADLDASLDPHVSSSSAGTREVLFNIYEGLVKPDKDGNLIPAVAEKWTVNETADEYTFTLRDGVKFHNGRTVTTGDVVYSLKRAAGLDTGTPLVSDVAGISSVMEADGNKVIVKLKAPDTEFITHAAVAVMPDGNNPADEIVGTGPFRFVSRSVSDNIVLEKNEDYWGKKAYLDKVKLKVIEDAETMVMSLKSGAVDLAGHMEARQADECSELNVAEGASNVVQALYLNNAHAPFDNIKVRQALCCAVDKQLVIDLAGDGHGEPVGSSMFPALKRYFDDSLTDYYKPDQEKAKALLAEAGYPDGFSFTINVASNLTMHVDTAQVIVEQLKQIGVTATINQVEWATWLSDTYQGRNFQATVVGMDAHGVAASDMLARFQSDSAKNFINFSSADYDAAYAKAISTIDEKEQTALFKDCERILTEQAANVYIQDPASFVISQKNVRGYEFYPLYVMDLSTIYETAR